MEYQIIEDWFTKTILGILILGVIINIIKFQFDFQLKRSVPINRDSTLIEGNKTEINLIVYELYGLTEEEISIIENGRNKK